MGSSAIKKSNMITQIVRLKQLLKRWKCNNLRGASDGRHTLSGSVAVYVGPERRRFVIPVRFLNLPVFVALLDQAEEEFGFMPTGGLSLPCETGFFNHVVGFLEEDEEKYRGFGLDEFLKIVLEPGFEPWDQRIFSFIGVNSNAANSKMLGFEIVGKC